MGDDTASAPPLSSGSVRFFSPEAADSIVAGRDASLSFFALFFDALQQDAKQHNSYAPTCLWHPPTDSYHVQSLHVCLKLARALQTSHGSETANPLDISWTNDDVFGHLQHIADLFGQKDKALLWFKQHEQKVQKTKRYVDARIGKEETGVDPECPSGASSM